MNRYEIRTANNEALTAFQSLPDDACEIFNRFFALDDCALYQMLSDGAAVDISEQMLEDDAEPNFDFLDELQDDDEEATFAELIADHLEDVKVGTKLEFLLKGTVKVVNGKFESINGKLVKLIEARWPTPGLSDDAPIWLNLDEVSGFRKFD